MSGADYTAGSGAVVSAVDWIAAVLTGPVGTSIAVLAIAAVGFALLRGRLPVMRGVTVVLGCFVLFGAHAIAVALMALAGREAGQAYPPAPPAAASAPPATRPPAYDPYAGASVPW